MFKKTAGILRVLAVCAAAALPGASAAAPPMPRPTWETVQHRQPQGDDDEAVRVEIAVRDGAVHVTTPRPVTVQVFTIIGRPISQETVPAGTSRLRGLTRGIYIVRTGQTTKRITI